MHARDGKTLAVEGMARPDLETVHDPSVAPSGPTSNRDILDELGWRIRHAREQKRVSLESAATKARMVAGRWRHIEAGHVSPTFNQLIDMADALGITVWQLLQALPPSR
jgi:ribosome-binding protein aMBF1 (putative translation factor)